MAGSTRGCGNSFDMLVLRKFAKDKPVQMGTYPYPIYTVYGSAPDYPQHDIGHWDLQPTMTLATRVIAVQQLAVGDTVGYGSSLTADAPLRIGVVACGYADGYPRHCTTGTPRW